jgi:hypothetical protein
MGAQVGRVQALRANDEPALWTRSLCALRAAGALEGKSGRGAGRVSGESAGGAGCGGCVASGERCSPQDARSACLRDPLPGVFGDVLIAVTNLAGGESYERGPSPTSNPWLFAPTSPSSPRQVIADHEEISPARRCAQIGARHRGLLGLPQTPRLIVPHRPGSSLVLSRRWQSRGNSRPLPVSRSLPRFFTCRTSSCGSSSLTYRRFGLAFLSSPSTTPRTADKLYFVFKPGSLTRPTPLRRSMNLKKLLRSRQSP